MTTYADLSADPIAVSTVPSGSKITRLSNGYFLVYWVDNITVDFGIDGGSAGNIHARLFSPTWTAIGTELVLNERVAGYQNNPVVVALANGGFAASWYSEAPGDPADSSYTHVAMRLFADDGSAAGSEFVANSVTAGFQTQFDLLALADGRIAALYRDETGGSGLHVRFFDSTGVAAGADVVIGGPETGRFYTDAEALANGGILLTWSELVGGKYDVRAQAFDSAGNAAAPAFTVNQDTSQHESFGRTTVLSDGRVLVTWKVEAFFNNIAASNVTMGRILNSDGTPGSNAFTISANADQGVLVTALSDGGFTATWQEQVTDNPNGFGGWNVDLGYHLYIASSRFDATGTAVGPDFRFETGSHLANATTSPDLGSLFLYESQPGELGVVWTALEYTQSGGGGTITSLASQVRYIDFGSQNAAPLITWLGGGDTSSLSVAENVPSDTYAPPYTDLGRVAVNDINGDRLNFTLSGEDAALFLIDPATGHLILNSRVNYESPGDANHDGVYKVVVTVSDGVQSDSQELSVTVTDVVNGVTLNGTAKGNTLTGTAFEDALSGLAGNDALFGSSGDDSLNGGSGNDTLTGGNDADILTGGSGRDTFAYTDIIESFAGNSDTITDFSRAEGDKISLSAIDANILKARNQAFDFIGLNDFTGVAGQLRYYQDHGNTFVTGDVDGDGNGDFLIMLQGLHTLGTTDFVL